MFNRERLKEAVAEYKKCFVQKWWPDEKYKWEMVKCFQVNWDVNADDFAAMLAKSLAKAAAILNAANSLLRLFPWHPQWIQSLQLKSARKQQKNIVQLV